MNTELINDLELHAKPVFFKWKNRELIRI